jgi:hypothetical protein
MQPFVTQGMSMSMHVEYDQRLQSGERKKKAEKQMKAFLIHMWKAGAKTLTYYVRSTIFQQADDFGVRNNEDDDVKSVAELEVMDGGACTSGGCDA